MRKPGFTMIELLAALTVIAIAATVSGLTLRTPTAGRQVSALDSTRRRSVGSGMVVTGWADSTRQFAAYPGGLVIFDRRTDSDSGEVHAR